MTRVRLTDRKEIFLLLLVLAAALALRLGVFAVIHHVDPSRILLPDSPCYVNTARALIYTGKFAVSREEPGKPQMIRTPGYPVFIAGIYRIFGERYFPVIVVQIFISAATILLTYIIARTLWNPGSALISGLLLSLDFASFHVSQVLLTETLFTFFIAFAAAAGLYLVLDRAGKAWVWALLLGLGLASATMVRPISYYLVFPVLMGFLVCKKIGGWRWRKILLVLSMIALPSILLVGGWQVRNFLVTGDAGFSHITAINLLQWRGACIVSLRDGITIGQARRKIDEPFLAMKNLPEVEVFRLRKREGLSLIRRYPLLHVKCTVRGLAAMILVPGESDLLKYLGVPLQETGCMGDLQRLSMKKYIRKWLIDNPLPFIFFLLALSYILVLYLSAAHSLCRIVALEKEAFAAHVFLWGVAIYFLIVSAGPEAYSRFRVPIMPVLAAYGGDGLSRLFQCLKFSRKLP